MIYIVVFTISLLVLKLSLESKKKIAKRLLLFMSIALPCFLAAIRSTKIGGIDMHTYILPLYKIAVNSNSLFTYLFNNIYNLNDYLYLVLNYVVAKGFNSFQFFLFISEVITIIPIYMSLKMNCQNKNQIVFGMFIFYMLMYNASYNMIRQSMSLSFSILAITYLNKGSSKKFFINVAVASLLHWSAIVVTVAYFINKFINSEKLSNKNKYILKLGILTFLILMIFFIPKALPLLKYVGVSAEKVNFYLIMFSSKGMGSFPITYTIYYAAILIIMFLYKKYYKKIDKEYEFYQFLLIIGIVILQYNIYIQFAFRLSYYFIYPAIFNEIPKCYHLGKNEKITKFDILIAIAFAAYWMYWVLIVNYDGTIPYAIMEA